MTRNVDDDGKVTLLGAQVNRILESDRTHDGEVISTKGRERIVRRELIRQMSPFLIEDLKSTNLKVILDSLTSGTTGLCYGWSDCFSSNVLTLNIPIDLRDIIPSPRDKETPFDFEETCTFTDTAVGFHGQD